MKMMKKGLFKRIASTFMASVMMLTSSVTDIITYSDPPEAEIGIYNHVYTADEEADVTYKLTFYIEDYEYEIDTEIGDYVIVGRKKVPLTASFDYGDLRLNEDGTITIPKNERVNFLDNPDFRTFIEENGVVFIGIDVDEAGNKQSANLPDGTPVEREKYKTSYSHSQMEAYDAPDLGSNYYHLDKTHIIYRLFEDNWDLYGYDTAQIAEVISTKYKPLVEIEQNWYDRGTGNRDPITNGSKDNFTVYLDGELYNVEDGYFEADTSASNTYIYKYYIPEKKLSDGYTVVPSGEQSAPSFTVGTNMPEYDSGNNHRTEPNAGSESTVLVPDSSGKLSVASYGLTSLDFTINWLDEARREENVRGEATDTKVKQFLTENFEFWKKEKDAYAQIDLADHTVTVIDNGDNTWSVSIGGLDDISTSDRSAIVYELRPKNGTTLDLPNPGNDETDTFTMTVSNNGVNSSENTKVFNEGTMSMLLTGTNTFTGVVEWRDNDNKTTREGYYAASGKPAAEAVIWRYVNTGNNDDIDRSAQVETVPIEGALDTETFTRSGLDKYDPSGRAYVYYAKEKINVSGATT